MEWLRRHRLAVGLILVVAIALLSWQLLPDTSELATPAARQAVTAPTSVKRPSPAPSADVPAPAAEPSAASASILRGRAVDAVTGEPVLKFEIRWRELFGEARRPFNSRQRTFETTDGRFEYTDVPPGKWTLIVTARNYQRFELPEFSITSGAPQELLLPLQKGYALRGRIYDEATGAGIAASIDVLAPSASMALRGYGRDIANTTAQDGSFVMEGVPPGRTAVAVEAKNYTSRTVLVEVGANTPTLEIGLSGGGTIAGRFTTAAGAPIAGGSVMLSRADGGIAGTSNTDTAGTFEFPGLETGKYQLAGRYRSAIVMKDITLSGSNANVQLALQAGRTISGMVTGLRPELFERVSITVRREGNVTGTVNRVNNRGEFELNDVAPGPVRVTADINRTREVSKSIEMPADADITVNLDFPSGAALSGRVTRNNKPLADVTLVARPSDGRSQTNGHHVRTSKTGTYALRDMEPGEYFVMVGSFLSKPLQVDGEATFDIDVPGGDLTGRLLDDSAGLPIAGASVDVYFADAAASTLRMNALSDHLGQFTIASVVPAEYVLTIYKPGYKLYRERISFDAQSAAPAIRLRQDEGVEIRGRDAASGRPVREIMVIESIGGRGGIVTNLQLDEDGAGYLPSGLAGSNLQLIAPGAGYVEIPSWDGGALDLRFEPAKKQ
jgi:5-hydroxyisourate hydrolase-like protein (transthyretin family)